MSAVTAETRTFEELLGEVVNSNGADRARAYGELLRAGYGGSLVKDVRCDVVFTVGQLYKHLVRFDPAHLIARRGWRMHTSVNVIAWSDGDEGHGPGLKRGPA